MIPSRPPTYHFDPMLSEYDLLPEFGAGDNYVFVGYSTIDWKETAEAHFFSVNMPGVKKEEVTVAVEEGCFLRISGERIKEEEENSDKWHLVERRNGKFMRRFRLPKDANGNGEVKASMADGVLTVIVPKVEMKNPGFKIIKISG